MKDQVDALCSRGVKAANLDSTLSAERSAWVKQEVLSGAMKILYVAPERYVTISLPLGDNDLLGFDQFEQRILHCDDEQCEDISASYR